MPVLSCDHLRDAPVYRDDRVIGHVTRLYLNSTTGAVAIVEVSRGFFKQPIFIRWQDLRFGEELPRITLVGDVLPERPECLASYLEDTYRLVGFWGFWGLGS
jgi:PRC-barrel domain